MWFERSTHETVPTERPCVQNVLDFGTVSSLCRRGLEVICEKELGAQRRHTRGFCTPSSSLGPFLQSACYVGNCGRSALLSFRAFSLTWPSAMQIQLPQHWFGTPIWPPWRHMKTFSLTWPRAIQIYWNKRKLLHKIKFQPLEDWFGTPTWPPFHYFETPTWQTWRHLKTLYCSGTDSSQGFLP